jgi:hypothetical protein
MTRYRTSGATSKPDGVESPLLPLPHQGREVFDENEGADAHTVILRPLSYLWCRCRAALPAAFRCALNHTLTGSSPRLSPLKGRDTGAHYLAKQNTAKLNPSLSVGRTLTNFAKHPQQIHPHFNPKLRGLQERKHAILFAATILACRIAHTLPMCTHRHTFPACYADSKAKSDLLNGAGERTLP